MFVIRNILLLLFLAVQSMRCQGVLPAMMANPNISKFTKLINDAQELKDYFNNAALVIFVPSDEAMNAYSLTGVNTVNLVKSHMFQSNLPTSSAPIVGTTSNWTNYVKITPRIGPAFYRMPSIGNLNTLFMYLTGTQFRVNEALVIGPNNVVTNSTQVYHIIDKVLNNSPIRSFISYLGLNPSLSKTLSFWQSLQNAADLGKLKDLSFFQSSFLRFSASFPYTVLVPNNAAWDAVGDTSALSNNLTVLASVMSRFFIPDVLLFLTGSRVPFKAGFNSAPQTTDVGLIDGTLTADLQVSVQNFTGKVIQSNIPISYGVVHIIDNAFVTPVTLNSYLAQNNRLFINKMTELNLTAYLNGGFSIMAMDDTTVAKLPGNVTLALLNSIIKGAPIFNVNGTYTTLGGLTVSLISMNSKYFMAVQQSPDDKTWISIVPVLSLNQMVGSTFVTRLNGSLNGYPSPCDRVLQTLNSSAYSNLLTVNNVTINIGSPYTLLAPNDASVLPYVANVTSQNSALIKYVVQRMIIANRLIFNTRTPGSFYAATMNYAAMLETINMTVWSNSTANISFNDFQQTFNFTGGGFYCYSNSQNDSTRFNLIYPVSFVVSSPTDAALKICVTSPCAGCQIKFNWCLLVAICLLVIRRISNGHI